MSLKTDFNDVDCSHLGHEVTGHVIAIVKSSIDVARVIRAAGTNARNSFFEIARIISKGTRSILDKSFALKVHHLI